MKLHSIETPTLSYIHNGRTHTILMKFQNNIEIRICAYEAAQTIGINRRTLQRWCTGSQKPPTSALKLLSIVYGGLIPWDGWEKFRFKYGRDHTTTRWLITHNDLREWWTPERLALQSNDYNNILSLQFKITEQQETINALSTRQAPPIPCAEIIPIEHYRKKN